MIVCANVSLSFLMKADEPTYTAMLNPEIIKKDGTYDTEEGCLSVSALGPP